MPVPLTAACSAVAATMLRGPEPALWTILAAEGGRVGACTTQANGSHDCGPAQINSETWTPHLSLLLHRPRDDGCFNIWTAAYVLRVKLGETHGDLWDAAGRYNSETPALKLAYQSRLVGAYVRMFGPGSGRRRAGAERN